MTDDDDDYHPAYGGSGEALWKGEYWLHFPEAVDEMVKAVGLSRGEAERTLRTLCGSGDIRSICCDEDCEEYPSTIMPEKWREIGELDLHGVVVSRFKWNESSPAGVKSDKGGHFEERRFDIILVSEADFQHWLKKQTPTTEAKKQQTKKALGKWPRIKAHLAKLFPKEQFPNGVPDPSYRPRKELLRDLLKIDPGLKPLDDGTLKTAIDEFNADLTSDPK